jgi:hypothetical protein
MQSKIRSGKSSWHIHLKVSLIFWGIHLSRCKTSVSEDKEIKSSSISKGQQSLKSVEKFIDIFISYLLAQERAKVEVLKKKIKKPSFV